MKTSIKKLIRRLALPLAIPILAGVAAFAVMTGIAAHARASGEARAAEIAPLPATGPYISPLYALAATDPVPAEAPDAAADPAPAPDAITTSPWYDVTNWDWAAIGVAAMSVLGGLVVIFRTIAPLTATTKDDWILAKLEWLSDLLARLFVPGRYRAASSGTGGKS